MSTLHEATNRATVKCVLSGDTLVLATASNGPEVILHLAAIASPRMGSFAKGSEDEPRAFDSREFMRRLCVGKIVRYAVGSATGSTGDNTTTQWGAAWLAPLAPGGEPIDVALEATRAGWVRVRDGGAGNDAEARRREILRAAESEAQAGDRGIWSSVVAEEPIVARDMPIDPQAFVERWRTHGELEAVVEHVKDGSSLRVRLLLDMDENGSSKTHQFINLALAGARSPRGNEAQAEEARRFVESRLLQRAVKVRLLSAPAVLGAAPAATAPVKSSSGLGGLPPPPTASPSSFIVGTVVHPVGNIAEFLLAAGLAKVVDWHAGALASAGGMDRLRAAEKAAKDSRKGVWESYVPPTVASRSVTNGSTGTRKGSTYSALVTRVWSGDTLSVAPKSGAASSSLGPERRCQLASVRGPRGADASQQYWASEAKEYLRRRLIGKTVKVTIDYIRPKEGEYDERECVTIHYGTDDASNISEQLIERGLATVLRHRRDDEDRSSELDKLIVAEQRAVAEQKGLHSTKSVSLARIVDASESAARAASSLYALKRVGKHNAIVDFVSSGSRFKILVPKENTKATFVLAGIRAPRTARNASEKAEPGGAESLAYSASHLMQRDVQIAFETNDKSGGFVGTMWNQGENVAVTLVRLGLATVHEYTADSLPYARELHDAQEQAQQARRGLWASYDENGEEREPERGQASAEGHLQSRSQDESEPAVDSTPLPSAIERPTEPQVAPEAPEPVEAPTSLARAAPPPPSTSVWSSLDARASSSLPVAAPDVAPSTPPAFLGRFIPSRLTVHPSDPFITLTYAQSMDGKIAGPGGKQIKLSGEESMLMTHWMRTLNDAIMIGVGTAVNDDPRLNIRLLPSEHAHRAPRPLILDPSLRLPPTARLLTTLRDPVDHIRRTAKAPWILCDQSAVGSGTEGEARKRELERAGAMVFPVPMTTVVGEGGDGAEAGRLDLSTLPSILSQLGIRTLMIEGGADVIRQCLSARRPIHHQQHGQQGSAAIAGHSGESSRPLVDRVIVTVAPVWISDGLPVLGDAQAAKGMSQAGAAMEHVHAETLGRDAVLVLQPKTASS